MHKVLTIGFDKKMNGLFKQLLGDKYKLRDFVEHEELLTCLSLEMPDALLVHLTADENLPIEWMEKVRRFDDNLPIVFVTEARPIGDVVSLMKAGANDYLTMPLDEEKLKVVVANACRLYMLTKRVFLLENRAGLQTRFGELVGTTGKMQEIFEMVRSVAKSHATVLIMGESGTGKELVARAVHQYSPRVGRRFIDINCGAIPKELLENELFGHERGAFTGADSRYIGCCERADGGTLFLDEISEMDMHMQVKLLRFIQERTFNRIGGTQQVKVDVRIVAATNRELHDYVREGKFREDLFYRLNVVPVHIPALRERRDDIPLLAKHFLEKYSQKNEKIFLDFAPDALEALIAYNWPGNVRELENTIERVVVLNNDTRVKLAHLPEAMRNNNDAGDTTVKRPMKTPLDENRIVPLDVMEKYMIEAALEQCGGNVSEAAKRLRIGQATLYRKIKQYGLRS